MPRATKNTEYLTSGITISPAIPATGENVKIVYDGLLAKSGANHIYAHVGFGSKWDNCSYYKMNKTTTGFESTIPVASSDTMNLCFKDCANNWDNNTGRNYSFDLMK